MLAEDVSPSRLDRAKADVLDLVAAVEEAGGHRLGLIAFAGSPSLKCPLTQVTSHFKLVLEGISPKSVPQGGTMIGDCIREAIDAFDDKTQNFRDLILITDGEDMDSFPVEAAAAARDAGITIYAIGIGDPNLGSRVPVMDTSGRRTYLEHQGEIVWSKLDDRSLKEIAQVTDGVYIPAGTRTIELDRIFRDVIEPKARRELGETQRERLRQRFQWFLTPALIFLIIELLMRDSRIRRRDVLQVAGDGFSSSAPAGSRPTGRQSLLPVTALSIVILVVIGHGAAAVDAGSLVREGHALYEKGKYAEASEKFSEAAKLAPTSPIPPFNQGAALFQSGDYSGAAKLYEQARVYASDDLRRQIDYAVGNCKLQQALGSEEPGAALEHAKQAVPFYRAAIGAKPKPSEPDSVGHSSRYNMELAKRLIQQKQEEQQQEQQQQQEQNKDEGSQQQQQQQPQQQDKQESGGEDKQEPKQDQPENKQGDQQEQQNSGKDSQKDASQSSSKDEAKQSAQANANDGLSADDAIDRLRAAIARAQVARARRLAESEKQGKSKPVLKDW
jgi:Ca-activated chloride channel family protein